MSHSSKRQLALRFGKRAAARSFDQHAADCRSDFEADVLRLIRKDPDIPDPDGINDPYINGYRYLGDFIWIEPKIVMEADGAEHGVGRPCPVCNRRQPGGHQTAEGCAKDNERDIVSQLNGWFVIRVTRKMVNDGRAMRYLKLVMKFRNV